MRTVAALGVTVYSLGAATLGLYAAEAIQFTATQRSFWSLQPVAKPAVAVVKNQKWVKTPIDAFILAKLTAQNLQPNPPADKVTLLRRATIDMTGLQPTQEESRNS